MLFILMVQVYSCYSIDDFENTSIPIGQDVVKMSHVDNRMPFIHAPTSLPHILENERHVINGIRFEIDLDDSYLYDVNKILLVTVSTNCGNNLNECSSLRLATTVGLGCIIPNDSISDFDEYQYCPQEQFFSPPLTVKGTLPNLNAAFETLEYVPKQNYNGDNDIESLMFRSNVDNMIQVLRSIVFTFNVNSQMMQSVSLS
mmetsp:Transcript_16204/g.19732  ORF Transcript_16204/g.19732 Transcript_16204/m.19732 type:complete len:201 (+) Transcript_16204:625-1227(+)